MKRTPLYAAHQRLGGKLIEFGGWEMPVQYTSIADEHLAVRRAAGIFDISHMGEVAVSGPGAEAFLNNALTNDVRKLEPGWGQYSIMCNHKGGAIDDLYVYRTSKNSFLLIINASRIEVDVAWLKQLCLEAGGPDSTQLEDISEKMGAVAVQGPAVRAMIDAVFPSKPLDGTVERCSDLKKNQIARCVFGTTEAWVASTGYTGEDGFEIVVRSEHIEAVWNKVLEIGAGAGLKPCGLGARDTLRTEVCYPLYGHELDEQTTPLEAGLGFFVSMDKGPFIGKDAMAQLKETGLPKRLVAFRMTDRSAPPRPHYPIWSKGVDAQQLGQVASGTQSPSLSVGIGMAYVPPQFAAPDTAIDVEIRGKRFPACVVRKPIYRKQ
jgi:aminomethyltransferase